MSCFFPIMKASIFPFQSKRRFERDCKEADRAQQYFEKMDADINVTKADVEKVNQRLERLFVNMDVIGLVPQSCW